jgi:hypothetical protein
MLVSRPTSGGIVPLTDVASNSLVSDGGEALASAWQSMARGVVLCKRGEVAAATRLGNGGGVATHKYVMLVSCVTSSGIVPLNNVVDRALESDGG